MGQRDMRSRWKMQVPFAECEWIIDMEIVGVVGPCDHGHVIGALKISRKSFVHGRQSWRTVYFVSMRAIHVSRNVLPVELWQDTENLDKGVVESADFVVNLTLGQFGEIGIAEYNH